MDSVTVNETTNNEIYVAIGQWMRKRVQFLQDLINDLTKQR